MTVHEDWLSCPYLQEDDGRIDFELKMDEITGQIGLLSSLSTEPNLRDSLLQLSEITYNLLPALRNGFALTEEEYQGLLSWYTSMPVPASLFVLPQGSRRACLAHVIRAGFNEAARRAVQCVRAGTCEADERLFRSLSALSNGFYRLASLLNKLDGATDIPFFSRVR